MWKTAVVGFVSQRKHIRLLPVAFANQRRAGGWVGNGQDLRRQWPRCLGFRWEKKNGFGYKFYYNFFLTRRPNKLLCLDDVFWRIWTLSHFKYKSPSLRTQGLFYQTDWRCFQIHIITYLTQDVLFQLDLTSRLASIFHWRVEWGHSVCLQKTRLTSEPLHKEICAAVMFESLFPSFMIGHVWQLY